METTPYVTALQESLATAAAAGDEQTKRTATLLASALEPGARLAIMQALADLAVEVTAALEDRVVEVVLDGPDVRVSVSAIAGEDDGDAWSETEPNESDPGPTRVTLRVPEGLKAQAEKAAVGRGVSLNAWLVRAVREALRSGPANRDRAGHVVRGWVRG